MCKTELIIQQRSGDPEVVQCNSPYQGHTHNRHGGTVEHNGRNVFVRWRGDTKARIVEASDLVWLPDSAYVKGDVL